MTPEQTKKYEEAARDWSYNILVDQRRLHPQDLRDAYFEGCTFASQDTEERVKIQLSQYAYERDKARQERDQAEERVKQAHNGAIDSISKLIREKSFSFTEEEIQKLKL